MMNDLTEMCMETESIQYIWQVFEIVSHLFQNFGYQSVMKL